MFRASSLTLVSFALFALTTLGCNHGGRGPGGPVPSGMTDGGTPPPAMDGGNMSTPPPPACMDECAAGTAPRCAGSGYQTCDRAADGCMRWSSVVACEMGSTCEAGVCRGGSCPGGCCPRCDGSSCGPGSDGCGGDCGCAGGTVCSDANFCCTPENGAASCNRILGSWCDRIVTCCTAPGAGECVDWAYSVTACRAHFLSTGFDCSSSEWTSAAYCREGIDICVGDIPLVACSDFYSGTASVPRTCP